MKNWSKNILTTILLTLLITVKAQNSITITSNRYNIWNVSNPPCYGCSSIYVMVVNTKVPDKSGFYFYDIYLWSNSFYTNGYVASSYVKNINFYMVDPHGTQKYILNVDYALVPPKSQYFNGSYYLGYIYSVSAKQTIKLTWSEINVW